MIVTEDWYVCSHRLPVLKAAVDAGHEVMVLTHVVDHAEPIRATGAQLVPIPLDRSSSRVRAEGAALVAITRALRRFRPDVVHNVALKPILYGTIAAKPARAGLVVNALAGLGDLFMTDRGWKHRILRRGMALAVKGRRKRVLVQNPEDADVVASLGVPRDRIDMIRGSGVDLDQFTVTNPPVAPPIVVLFVGRLLESKGLHELHEAALILRDVAPQVEVRAVGDRDPHNPGCIDEATLDKWQSDGAISFLGRRNDVPALLSACHIVVLPSYREGVPKSLLEGAAAGRPLVATDVPGNREAVHHDDNGLLVPAHDVAGLVDALLALANDEPRRTTMGRRSRQRAEAEFSDESVAALTLAIYAKKDRG